mmetsp:Transcript_4796/g.6697  ORF Transcript_4796/g.6697 Transcript_4796/m.6697 type:complete len:152 (+) Transcript_4796:1067-1522(+)
MIPKEYQHQFPKPTEPLSKSTKKRKQKTNEQEQVEVLEDNPSKKDLAVIDNTIAKRKASEVESAPPPKKHQGSNCTKKPSKSREFSMDVERITSEGLKRKHKPNNCRHCFRVGLQKVVFVTVTPRPLFQFATFFQDQPLCLRFSWAVLQFA